MTKTKRSVLTAVCIALCVVLPMAFHAVPNAGQIFLPMHIPVLLAGLCCGWPFGLLAGVAGPLLSSLFTGMPPLAYLPSMLCELALYGLLSGAFSSRLRSGRLIRLNNEFMVMTSRFHGLHRLLERLRGR